jgi:hypothetical protein
MATISLGKAPKNFKKLVRVPMLDGTEGTVECVFKYRTVTAYGEWIASLSAEAGIKADTSAADFSLKAVFERTRDKNGEFLMKILDGWNLDEEFSQANAQQLCDELPGAASAIFDGYRTAIVEGRLGN